MFSTRLETPLPKRAYVSKSLEVNEAPPLQLLRVAVSSSDFVEATSIGLVMYDESGSIIDCNDAATSYFQCARSDLLGRLIIPGVRLQNKDGTQISNDERPGIKSFREQRVLKDVLVGIDIPSKPLRWARVSTNLVDLGGELQGVIANLVDCTSEIELSKILELGASMLGEIETVNDPSELLQKLCDVLVVNGRYPLAWIATDVEDGRGTVEVSYSAGVVGYLHDGIVSLLPSEPNGIGPVAKCFRTQEVVIAGDLLNGESYKFWREQVQEFGFSSAVSIPFHTTRSHVLTIYDRHTIAFDQAIITGIVEMTNTFAQRAQILATLARVKSSLEGTIASLGQLTEERDRYTEGHQTRVGELSAAIARTLEFDSEAVDTIRLAGDVHDVGKISVPAEILTRPGKLGALEFELIKRHCEVGANILQKASLPKVIVEVALQHHERLDGSGYPHGLSGDQIGMPARIVAVADVVEAMMHYRPYRQALGLEAALTEVTRGSGTLFDVNVVAACIAQFEAGFEFES